MDYNYILNQLLKEWKNKLNLQNWDIQIKLDDNLCNQGEIEVEKQNCTALIKIKNPDKWDNKYFTFNIEQVLIHELLHIKFVMFEPNEDIIYTLYHQQLNDISIILYKLKHNKYC